MTIARFIILTVLVTLATFVGAPPAHAQRAPDGLPVTIPPPGSPPPTTAEWNAVRWEVSVSRASAYHCETKMVREWLRVSCSPYSRVTPSSVSTIQSHGYQAYTLASGQKASVTVQVVRGRMYVARFTWSNGTSHDLTANWPSNAARPLLYFN